MMNELQPLTRRRQQQQQQQQHPDMLLSHSIPQCKAMMTTHENFILQGDNINNQIAIAVALQDEDTNDDDDDTNNETTTLTIQAELMVRHHHQMDSDDAASIATSTSLVLVQDNALEATTITTVEDPSEQLLVAASLSTAQHYHPQMHEQPEEHNATTSMVVSRAKHMSVLLAPSANENGSYCNNTIGLRFWPDQGSIIAAIEDGSELAKQVLRHGSSLIQPGDQLVSFNGQHCQHMSSQEIVHLIYQEQEQIHNSSWGYLNMVFQKQSNHHNDHFPNENNAFNTTDEHYDDYTENSGTTNPNLVESIIIKSSPDDALGIRVGLFHRRPRQIRLLQAAGNHPYEVRITEIIPNCLGGQSLLNVGDVILQINGISCLELTAHQVIDILRTARNHVHIVTLIGSSHTAIVTGQVNRIQDFAITLVDNNHPTQPSRHTKTTTPVVIAPYATTTTTITQEETNNDVTSPPDAGALEENHHSGILLLHHHHQQQQHTSQDEWGIRLIVMFLAFLWIIFIASSF